MRKKVEENLEAKEHAKRVSIVAKYQKVLHMNVLCEMCILTRMNNLRHGSFDDVSVVELKEFEKARPEWLQGFIHCRLFDTPNGHIKANYKWPNKGRVKQCANHDHDCLLQRAYDVKHMPVKMAIPQESQNVLLSDQTPLYVPENGVLDEDASDEE